MLAIQPRKLELDRNSVCSDIQVDDIGFRRPFVTHSISYYNYTNHPIVVRERLGFPQVIPPEHEVNGRIYASQRRDRIGFYIRYSIELTAFDLPRAKKYYKSLSAESPLMKAMYERLCDIKVLGDNREAGTYKTDVVINLDEGQFYDTFPNGNKYRHPIYIEELGISLGIESTREDVLETPESLEDVIKARRNSTTLALKDSADDSALISIEAVDSSGHRIFSNLYVSLLNRVCEIPIRYDSTAGTHGIVIRSHPSVAQLHADPMLNRTDILTEQFTFEEAAERFGICDSIEAAKSRGDSKRSIEREIIERQTEIKRLDVELAEKSRVNKLEDEAYAERERMAEEDRKRQIRMRDEEQQIIAHRRTMEKMAADYQVWYNKHMIERQSANERSLWDALGSVVKTLGGIFSIGGGLSKLLTT